MSAAQINRREFLEAAGVAGAGFVIGFHLPAGGRNGARAVAAPFAPNAWLRIGADESVVVVVDRSEMGQGVTTSLPMLLAEELEADWSKIRIESAPADKAYINPMFGMQGTGGSTSVRAAFTPLRKAGAAAREMLLSAAAETWGVDKAACRAEKGAVIHTPSNRRLSFGTLAAKAATVPLPHDVPLKDPKDWKILGTRVKRLDSPAKVDGSAVFGIDVKAPGLLVAVVARSPVFGGKVQSFDAAKAKAVPGVKHVVQISSGVAVVADGYWSAKKGRDALDVTWDEGPMASASSATISQLFGQRAEQAGAVARHDGDAQAALPGAAAKLDAAYELPFLAHATMEPMNCTAHVRADGVDIWAPTQFQTGAQGLGAGIGGVPPEKVKVHTTYLGGGFGRRFELDFIKEALEASKATGVPVKVIWSREDDTRNAQYRPACYHRLQAGLDASGQPVAWAHRVVAPSIMARVFPDTVKNGLDEEAVEGGVGMPYAVPNVHVDYVLTDTGIPVGFWRSVNNSYNAFVVESFIDELAHAAKKDPYEYRRDLLGKAPRHLGALNLAASKAGWGTPLPRDRRVQGVRFLRGRGGRGLGGVRRSPSRAPGGLRGGLRTGREPRYCRSPDAERHRVWTDRRVVGRDNDRQGPRTAEQLPRLPDAALGGDAGGGGPHRAQQQRTGRRGRAGHAPDRAGRVQRTIRADRQEDQEAADRKNCLDLTP